jgi:hypothetical protein
LLQILLLVEVLVQQAVKVLQEAPEALVEAVQVIQAVEALEITEEPETRHQLIQRKVIMEDMEQRLLLAQYGVLAVVVAPVLLVETVVDLLGEVVVMGLHHL